MCALPFSTPSYSIPGLIGTGLLLALSNGVIAQIRDAIWVNDKEMPQQQTRNGADLKTALGRLGTGLDMALQGRTNDGQNMRAVGVLTP